MKRESQLPIGSANGSWFSAKTALERKLIDGIIPVEAFYASQANALPDRRKYSTVEFVEYRAQPSPLEKASKKMGRMIGLFAESFHSEVTHREIGRAHV